MKLWITHNEFQGVNMYGPTDECKFFDLYMS